MVEEIEGRGNQRRRGTLATALRAPFHFLIKLFVFAFYGVRLLLRPRAVRYGIIALALLAGGAWWASSQTPEDVSTPLTAAGMITTAPASQQLPAAPVVDRYLQAQSNYDGAGMWDSLSDGLQQAMTAGGASVETLNAELESVKQEGRSFQSATYVGGVPLDEGQSVFFYVVNVRTPEGVNRVPYIFVVDNGGKISTIQ